MKKIQHIMLCFLLLGGSLLASEPGSFNPIASKPGATLSLSGSSSLSKKLVLKKEASLYAFNPSLTMNRSCITGQVKSPESTLMRMLHWDCKIKWRLNRNLNVILTYN